MLNPNVSDVVAAAPSYGGDRAAEARPEGREPRPPANARLSSAPADPTLALSFSEVTKRFRNGTLALDRVSWSIRVGARACLLGPNGAEKSTAIRLPEGALRPTSGQVFLLLFGAILGPLVVATLVILMGVAGWPQLVVLAILLLNVGSVAKIAALRWLTFERYLA